MFVIAATPKFAAQAIRKSYDLGWEAVRYITNVSPSIATVLKPAGLEKSKGLITGNYGKDVNDPKFKDDAGVKLWKAFCDKYLSATEFGDLNASYGFGAAQTMVQVLKQCGYDLSRDNILKQAANIKDLELPMLLPGIKLNTSPTNYGPISAIAARAIQRRKLAAVRRSDQRLRVGLARRTQFGAQFAKRDSCAFRPRFALSARILGRALFCPQNVALVTMRGRADIGLRESQAAAANRDIAIRTRSVAHSLSAVPKLSSPAPAAFNCRSP